MGDKWLLLGTREVKSIRFDDELRILDYDR